jgi:NTP pyrophosphatase (non-canonical NTP hydrolase)
VSNFITIQKAVHELAKQKGWYDEPRTTGECIALMHSELSEALESYRNGEKLPVWQQGPSPEVVLTPISAQWKDDVKPEGILTELADCVIRIMDFCESRGWDLERAIKTKHRYNETRSHRDGGKVI